VPKVAKPVPHPKYGTSDASLFEMDEDLQEELFEVLGAKRPPWQPFTKNIKLRDCIDFASEYWKKYGYK